MVLQFVASAPVNLLLQLSKATGHMGGVAVQHGRVAGFDLPGMVQDDHLKTKIEKNQQRKAIKKV